MRKFLALGILASILFIPLKSRAVPLDVPYQILVDTVSVGQSVQLSTTNFPSGNTTVNTNAQSSQWCVSHLVVSAPVLPATITMFWSTATWVNGTTDYIVVNSSVTPYNEQWPYRQPYCDPTSNAVLNIRSSVAGSTITVEGYLFKGWNP